jgi:hypothetical protein
MLGKTLAIILFLAAASAQAAVTTPLDRPDTGPTAGPGPLLLAQVSTLYGSEQAWPIEIDIKPGSETNEIPIKTERVFPIAIFGSEKLDITRLNPRTIRVTAADKKLVGRADTRTCLRKDLNGDSRDDLICDVKTVAFRLEPGELLVTLVAETYEHQSLKGTGTIRIVGN